MSDNEYKDFTFYKSQSKTKTDTACGWVRDCDTMECLQCKADSDDELFTCDEALIFFKTTAPKIELKRNCCKRLYALDFHDSKCTLCGG